MAQSQEELGTLQGEVQILREKEALRTRGIPEPDIQASIDFAAQRYTETGQVLSLDDAHKLAGLDKPEPTPKKPPPKAPPKKRGAREIKTPTTASGSRTYRSHGGMERIVRLRLNRS